MVSEGEVNGLEDFREEKAKQSSEVRAWAKNLTVSDGIHIFLSEVLMLPMTLFCLQSWEFVGYV